MSTQTTNLQLTKPDEDDFYDISVQNGNMDIIDEEITELKKSVSDGKTLVANAITEKGVTTASDATFSTMATNIGNIETGTDTSDATATASQILSGATAYGASGKLTGTMADYQGKNLGYQPSGETYVDDGTQVTRLYFSNYVAMKKASNSLPLIRIKLGASGAVDANTYVDVPVNNLSEGNIKAGTLVGYSGGNIGITGTFTADGTASATDIISGKIAYVNGNKVTGTMTSKAAATYTPNDSAQTIASGQYLSGVQTISAVPTETKSVTAGTSATTVSRTSGKYMISVTVNPTPSQTKSVTLTSSPLTVYPDSGYLLSSVTVSADLGKKYASGTTTIVETSPGSSGCDVYYNSGGATSSGTWYSAIPKATIPISFTPSVVKIKFDTSAGWSYEVIVTAGNYSITANRVYGTSTYQGFVWGQFSIASVPQKILDTTSSTTSVGVWLPGISMLTQVSNMTNITYDAWE